jgi:hypothetical protein
MVPQAPAQPLRRVLDVFRPAVAVAPQEHLHYDRAERVWRTHAELGIPTFAAPDGELVGVA